MTFALILYALCVSALTTAEWRDDSGAQGILKPLCALGFILLAVICGALNSTYGLLILLALMFCALGDVALLSRDKPKLFKIGMAAFGLGHSVLAAAFFSQGFNPIGLMTGVLLGLLAATLFVILIWRDVPQNMRSAVCSYIVIIGLMLVTATSVSYETGIWIVWLGAVMFAASDIIVARDRFVTHAPWHPFIITPLYFGAQALFALSVLQF